ncbi:MAG: DUF1846 domain-containing protein [Kiritimatiellae bacterium]|nr:DUF1846 domain-containing protein [Kiritimatiellia bacterium]
MTTNISASFSAPAASASAVAPGVGFDSDRYVAEQSRYILERVERADGGKLYLECGGKLLFDFHAARCLPGFEPSCKMRVFEALKDRIDVIVCIYAGDIERRKMRADFGISYDSDVLKMIDDFARYGLACQRVVITRYEGQPAADAFRQRLEARGISVFLHAPVPGYPDDIDTVVSDRGYGANPYVPTDRPIVLVTGPGPGSGKLATCLSQIYHDARAERCSSYAKFETFPVWNLPLEHPVNLAYEAATADIGDVNLIDHFHLAAYSEVAVNYSRDLEAFPLLRRIFERITGRPCPYRSPTDMGVNRVAFGIVDDAACRAASLQEILRRRLNAQCAYLQGFASAETVARARAIAEKAGIDESIRPVIAAAAQHLDDCGAAEPGHRGVLCSAAIEMPRGTDRALAGLSAQLAPPPPGDAGPVIVVGHNSDLMHAASAAVLNALKVLAGIKKSRKLISAEILQGVKAMKRGLATPGISLNVDEILLCLAMSATQNPDAADAVEMLPRLRGLEAHLSHIPPTGDAIGLRKLGLHVTSAPAFPTRTLYAP